MALIAYSTCARQPPGTSATAGKRRPDRSLRCASTLTPLIQFNGDGKPTRTDLAAALSRQRIAMEIPSDIGCVKRKIPAWRENRLPTRWAFTEALLTEFFVAEFTIIVEADRARLFTCSKKGR